MNFEKIVIDNSENGLEIIPGDMDGFQIIETNTEIPKEPTYIYYTELDKLIQGLYKIKKMYNNISGVEVA